MTDQYAYAQAQVDKVALEKIALINEMDEIKLQLRRYDKEASMVCMILGILLIVTVNTKFWWARDLWYSQETLFLGSSIFCTVNLVWEILART